MRLSVHGVANGGDGVARADDGRVVFVRGALPGDTVDARIISERKRFAHGEVVRVVDPAPGRTPPPCRHVAEGCGGCDLQHADLALQRELKVRIVVDALERIGRFTSPEVSFGGGVHGLGYRTNARCGVADGKAAFRRFHSNDLLQTPDCLIVHELVGEVMAEGDFATADEVVIRVGARTGERSVLVSPTAEGVAVPDSSVLGADALERGEELVIHEEAAGRRWRISAGSFFQSSPDAADLLVEAVRARLAETTMLPGSTLCDLYSGVGLFSGGLGHDGPVVAVEGTASAVVDAEHNLADLDATIVHAPVHRWAPQPADVVVADPSRKGLAAPGVAAVAGTDATTVVLVSCDAAACARDARLLADAGYTLAGSTVLDLFPQTSHVEVVSLFVR